MRKFIKTIKTRPVTWADVKQVAGWCNDVGLTYAIHGGWAMRVWGSQRPALDLDIIIPYIKTEYEKIKAALANLPGGKVGPIDAEDMMIPPRGEVVCRVIDDITIDIMNNVCDLNYEDMEIVPVNVVDVSGGTIPFASGSTMYRIKQQAGHDSQRHRQDSQFLLTAGYTENYVGAVNDPLSPPVNKTASVISPVDPVVDLGSL